MILGKIKSHVLSKALESKKFFSLSCYLNSYQKQDECFISVWNTDYNTWDLRVALGNYCLNDPESEELFQFAEKLIGEKKIDFTVISIILL